MSPSDPFSQKAQELHLSGLPICPGIAIGRPFFFSLMEEKIPEFSVPDHQIDIEVARYYKALKNSRQDIASLQKRLQGEGVGDAAAILNAHLEMTHDPLMTTKVEEAIREKRKNPEYVFKNVIGEYEQKFLKVSDQFFRERLKDFQDITRRIVGHLRQREKVSLASITKRSIVFAYELSPSDTAEANLEYIEGFVTKDGSDTSHVAIMARARGIPFVSGVNFPDLSVALPPQVIVDGYEGKVIINPSRQILQHYRQEKKRHRLSLKGIQKKNHLQAETYDGVHLRLSANVEMFDELDVHQEGHIEGIGLFRSEYLCLARESFPSEEEQFMTYKSLVERISGYPAVIRTFDIGGDKLGYFNFHQHERNPFLGCRGIRLLLQEKDLFKSQVRAILRASAYGDIHLLLPMVSGLSELLEAKNLIQQVKSDLELRNIPFNPHIPVGCMVEVPSAALICDLLATHCDFISIGTNDLVQYALAVDRNNPSMSYLYDPAHPAVLRLIQMTVHEANKVGIPVSVCGEIAADPRFAMLLVGLGVHELSLAPPFLPVIKNLIRHLSIVDAKNYADQALLLSSPKEVQELLNRAYETLCVEQTFVA